MHKAIAGPDGLLATDRPLALLRVRLLGGFQVERAGVPLQDSAWLQRRTAKTLVKLLATHSHHALHREHILEILWRDVELKSALNSLGKSIHAARHALEPGLEVGGRSAYLHLREHVISLDPQHVQVDADQFEQTAHGALTSNSVAAIGTALSLYGGELLPEDRYEDWSAPRRNTLSALHIQLLLRMAEALEQRGAYAQAVDPLQLALQQDPTREDAHRRLIHLYAAMGRRGEAVRQFQLCRDALKRELDLTPDRETEAVYQDVLANRIKVQPFPGGRLDGHRSLFVRQTAEAYGELVDRLDTSGQREESAVARMKLAMTLIALAKFDRALDVLRQARQAYAVIGDEGGMKRVANQIELLELMQAEWYSHSKKRLSRIGYVDFSSDVPRPSPERLGSRSKT